MTKIVDCLDMWRKVFNFTPVKTGYPSGYLTSGKIFVNPLGRGCQCQLLKGFLFSGLLLNQGHLMVKVSVPRKGISCQLTDAVQTVHRDIKTSSDACSDKKRGGRTKTRRNEDLTETIANLSNFNLGVRGAHSVLTSLLQIC